MELESIQRRLAEIHCGRKWIVATDVAAGATSFVNRLFEWGAADVLVVAGADGVGEQPDARVVSADLAPTDTMMGGIRESLRRTNNPAPEVLAAVDEFDPDGDALVVIADFHRAESAFGRRVYGVRSREIEALEDKTVVDELWDAAGVQRAPMEIVAVDEAPAAAARLAGPLGTVWAADNRLGWHGGGNYTRWVSGGSDTDANVAWFSECADEVRVMPFLDGIPCSIHGFVATSGVAVFRPCEMVTLRNPRDHVFVYGGVATFWDPRPDDREAMRDVARRVARLLAARHGYLGPFSIDGVMTSNGFRPTELNPRMSAGMGRLASTVPDLSIGSMVRALREGDLEFDAAGLEPLIVSAADAERAGGAYTVVLGQPAPDAALAATPMDVAYVENHLRTTKEGETPTGAIEVGDNPAGAFVRFVLDPAQVEPGPSIGPIAVALVQFIESEWRLEIGPVEAAPNLRA